MAKNASHRWNDWRVNAKTGASIKSDPKKDEPKRKRKMPGITARQARYLASLQRELGVPYTGDGMTKHRAQMTISKCLKELGRDSS